MPESVDFGVYVPSYKRSGDKVRMYDHLEYCTYVVRASEESAYRAAGIDHLWVVEDTLISDIHKVHDYIIRESPERVICIVDDDGKFAYRNYATYDMTAEQASAELERIAQMIVDLRLGMACTSPNPRPYNFDAEFRFYGLSGGCKWFNKQVFKGVIDPDCQYNFDCDLVLQELLVNRVILSPKYFIDVGGNDTNAGGSNTDKNNARFVAGVEHTKAKWKGHFVYNYANHNAKLNVSR